MLPVLLSSWGCCFFHLGSWKLEKPYGFWSFQGLEKRNIDSKWASRKIAEKLSLAGYKKQQSIGIKSFHSNSSYGFECKENCISKMSIKMFINKNRARKAYAYRMLLNFKTSVTPDNCVRCQADFIRHSWMFCRALSDVRCDFSGLNVDDIL